MLETQEWAAHKVPISFRRDYPSFILMLSTDVNPSIEEETIAVSGGGRIWINGCLFAVSICQKSLSSKSQVDWGGWTEWAEAEQACVGSKAWKGFYRIVLALVQSIRHFSVYQAKGNLASPDPQLHDLTIVVIVGKFITAHYTCARIRFEHIDCF
jgi:hypothetical protein